MKFTDTSQHPSHCTITTCNLTNTIEFTHSIKKISVVTKEKINANNKKRTKTMLQMLSRINTLWLTCSRTDAGAARTYDFNSEELSCYWLKKGEHIKSKKKLRATYHNPQIFTNRLSTIVAKGSQLLQASQAILKKVGRLYNCKIQNLHPINGFIKKRKIL